MRLKFIVIVSWVYAEVAITSSYSEKIAVRNITSSDYSDHSCKTCCENTVCIRKCCKLGYHFENRRCVNNRQNVTFTVPLYRDEFHVRNVTPKHLLIGTLKNCTFHPLRPFLDPNETFYLQENFTLWVPEERILLDNSMYCVEYTGVDLQFMVLKCITEVSTGKTISLQLNYIGMIISMPFLLATFFIYAILPDRNLHMKALMCYVLNLFVGYVLLVIIQLSTIDDVKCAIIGYLCMFFLLVSFFWMNVLCVDIFLGFRGFRGVAKKKSSERKLFLWYNMYAWGMPSLIVIVVLIIDKVASTDEWFHPSVGVGRCFIRMGMPEFLYFYLPMGILITINMVLFAITAINIRQMQKDTALLREGDSKIHENEKQQFNLYLKLLLAMGVNWSTDIVTWAVNFKYGNTLPYLWYITDFCNAIYGVFIFFIFVFKKNIWKQLQGRWDASREQWTHSICTKNQTKVSSERLTLTASSKNVKELK